MDRPSTSGGAVASTPTSHATPSPVPASVPASVQASAQSTKDALFGQAALHITTVEVPNYGTARVASLTQGQWEDLNERHKGEDGKTDTGHGYMTEAVAAALVEADGSYVFPDPVEGATLVRKLALPAVAKLFEAVARSSGLTQEARDALVKDSGPTPSGGG